MESYLESRAVPDRLAPVVTSIVGYRESGGAPGVHVGLPSTSLTLIIPIGGPILVGGPSPGQARPQALGAFIGGLHTAPAAVHHDGSQFGVQLALTPIGSRLLTGMPAGQLAMQLVDTGSIWGGIARELDDVLHESRSWQSRFDAVELALVRALQLVPSRHGLTAVRPQVRRAWQLLAQGDDGAAVHDVAREVGWSERHLLRAFRAELGVTPKEAARLHRFERSVALVRSGTCGLADTATVAGYADQSHLNREWRELAGTSPRAWLASETEPEAVAS